MAGILSAGLVQQNFLIIVSACLLATNTKHEAGAKQQN